MAFTPAHRRSTNDHLTSDSHLAQLVARDDNTLLLESLRSQAIWHEARQPYDIDHYELHTHPDFLELLEELGRGCPARLVPAYGIALLVRGDDRPFAAAVSMHTLLVKVSEQPSGLRGCALPTWFVAPGWVGVDSWQPDLRSDLATECLRACLRTACDSA
jgi:hypothetical protein